MTPFAKTKISRLLCGFREGHSAQHALFRKCRKCLDDGGVVGMVLMDVSKAFDCLPYDLLIAKLEAYGFGMKCLRFINSYLSGRKQRVKIGSTFTDWLDIASGVPQCSVLGPLLFNTYVNDLIYFIQNTEICNFADDNTIYSCGTNLDGIIIDLEEDLCQALEWFESNRLVANPSKFQMMLLGTKRNDKICMEVNGATVCPSASVKLLGITIDAGLKFDQHVKTLCQKVNKNVKAFSRVAKLLDLDKAKLLYNSFLLSNTPFQVKPRRVLAGAWGELLGEKHSCARFEREDLLCCDAKFRFVEDLVAVSSLRRTLICCAQSVIFGNSFFKAFTSTWL